MKMDVSIQKYTDAAEHQISKFITGNEQLASAGRGEKEQYLSLESRPAFADFYSLDWREQAQCAQ